MITLDSICLIDFCGYTSPSHFPISFWCDWNPQTGLITFGGEWQEIDPVYSATEPSEAEIEALEEFCWWRVSD